MYPMLAGPHLNPSDPKAEQMFLNYSALRKRVGGLIGPSGQHPTDAVLRSHSVAEDGLEYLLSECEPSPESE
jgi:hypothetical protein